MLRIKTTKTSLYKLIKEKTELTLWVNLPMLGKARFWKAFRRPDYFLEWYWNGYFYQAFLSTVGGTPLLTIERSIEGEQDHRQVFRLTVDELRERGMVEYVPEKGGDQMKYPPSPKKAQSIITAYEQCHKSGTAFRHCQDCKARGEMQYMRLPCKYCYQRAKAVLGKEAPQHPRREEIPHD